MRIRKETMMPQFSIIIPIYKVEQYLSCCIDSVLRQTYRDYEIILVDDGSPDGCPQICDAYAREDGRITVIHQENAGIAAARNSGIREAKGQYLCFIDSDDWWSDSFFLEKASIFLEKAPVDVLAFGDTRVVNGEGSGTRRADNLSFINHLNSEQQLEELIRQDKLLMSAWSHMLKTDFVRKNALLFDEAFLSCEDIEWFIRVLSCKPVFKAIDSAQYIYRVRPGSFCTRAKKSGDWENRYKAIVNSLNTFKQAKLLETDYRALMGYVSYQYYLLLASIIDEPEVAVKKDAYNRCKELSYLRKYALGTRSKICRAVIDILGPQLGSRILNLRMQARRRTNQ